MWYYILSLLRKRGLAMKFDLKKIFVFGALFVTGSLALTGCLTHSVEDNKGDDTENNNNNNENPSGDDVTPTTTFPAEALQTFLTSEGLTTTVPSPVSTGTWTHEVKEDEQGKFFFAKVDDAGTVGTNSLEDTYVALLRNTTGWVVDDTDYQEYGYFADKGDVELQFFTEEGKFNFYAYKYVPNGSELLESKEFPAKELQTFLTSEGLTTKVPSPVSQSSWGYSAYEDEDLGNCFYAETEDKGTVGTDSIEDTYKAALVKDNWEIDESAYEDDGIYATKGDVELLFFSYLDTFCFYAYAAGEDNPVTPVDPTNPDEPENPAWTLVTNVSDLNSGDVIVIGESSKSVVLSGDIDGGSSSKYFGSTSATFTNGVIDSLPNKATQFTLGKSGNSWTLSNNGELLGATAEKKLAWDNGITKWSISIDNNGDATIQNDTEDYGRILYNSSSPRFTTYTSKTTASMLLPEIYKLGGNGGTTPTDPTTPEQPEPKEKAEWTVMIYMCGADLESDNGYASADIKEILSVANQPDDVNIIIETGGASKWKGNLGISAGELGRWHIENKQLKKDTAVTKASMGLQSTFESFLTWGLTYYPAEKTGVVLWNHGGALDGCCYDENYKNDCLTPSEVKGAFDKVLENDQKLEFIGYDCCLMQVQDIAEFNSKYFNYMIAAEESEAGEGWAYDAWVDDLYAKKSTENILKAVCDGFIQSYDDTYGAEGYDNDQTLSVLDLTKMAAYKESFEALAASLKEVVKTKAFNDLLKTVKNYADEWMEENDYLDYIESGYYTEDMFDSEVEDGVTYYLLHGYYDYASFDAKDLLNKLNDNTTLGLSSGQKTNISNALTALNALIIYNKVGAEAGESHGLALICPVDDYTATNCYPASETNFVTWQKAVTDEGRVY